MGRSFPLGGNSGTSSSHHQGLGQSERQPGGISAGSTTLGPHSSNLANKADPRVDSDLSGSRNAADTAYGSPTGGNSKSANQGSLQQDTALATGMGTAEGLASGTHGHGPESWEHDHQKHGHTYGGDPCGSGETTSTGSTLVSGYVIHVIVNTLPLCLPILHFSDCILLCVCIIDPCQHVRRRSD